MLSRDRLCEHSSRVICIRALLPGLGGAFLPWRFRRTPAELVLRRAELAFRKPLFIKKVRTLGSMHCVKEQRSLWPSACALQVKVSDFSSMELLRLQGCFAGGWRGRPSVNGSSERSLIFPFPFSYFVPKQ